MSNTMYNDRLADILVDRLNELCCDNAVRDFVGRLVNERIEVANSVVDHPFIQINVESRRAGIIGLLNGIVNAGRGTKRIIAVFNSETGDLLRFVNGEGIQHRDPYADFMDELTQL